MKYISTRNSKIKVSFIETFLNGLALDGGLYIPKIIPKFSKSSFYRLSKLKYHELAFEIIKIFTDKTFSNSELKKIIKKSYSSFSTKEVIKLSKIETYNLLELYHGPTFAFKDIAMQIIGNMYENILLKKKKKINLIVATSGDTGAAAINAIANKQNVKIFVLFPKGKISSIQRKLMTTVSAKNVFNIAIKGTFDDCQNLVKSMFNDSKFRNSVNLSGVNSINWARIIAQVVYYFYAYLHFTNRKNKMVFSVPTGNFGDIYAGYIAFKMGVPISKLIIATNENDLLDRFIKTGIYKPGVVKSTVSPSMDIQVASNFERLISDFYNHNSRKVKSLMKNLEKKKFYKVSPNVLKKIKNIFYSNSVHSKKVINLIKFLYKKNHKILDPHTTIGLFSLMDYKSKNFNSSENLFFLGTAHPAKFKNTIEKAIDKKITLPKEIKNVLNKKEKVKILPNNLNKVKNCIKYNSLY